MRLFTGLVAALLVAAPLAAIAAPQDFDLASAPVAQRGQVIEAGGVKTFTADNGWYTMTMAAGTTTDVDQGLRYFTCGKGVSGHYVDMAVATNGLEAGEQALGIDAVEGGMAGMINGGYVPSLLQGMTVTERKILALGNGNGRKPMQLMVWIAPNDKTVTVVASTMLPKGNLVILIDADTAVDAEVVLREHFRIAEGVLE